jgi:predicted lysophospholipase L1 biosynthesis ABC-type transport system permease subunit
MSSYTPDFWPLFWGIIAGAAALTTVLSLLIASVPLPRSRRRPPARVVEMARRHREEPSEQALAAGQR